MPQTAWMKLVMDLKKKNPGKKLGEVMKMAKLVYKPKK